MKIIFVCSGNTCRSPLAEALFRKKTEKYKGNLIISSRGISAEEGISADLLSVAAAEKIGIDISNHRSKSLTADDIDSADIIVCMTETQKLILDSYTDKAVVIPGEIQNPAGDGLDSYLDISFELSEKLDEMIAEDYFAKTRRAGKEDIGIIAGLEKECFLNPYSFENIKEEFESGCEVSFICEYLGVNAGYILAQDMSGDIFINRVAVSKNYRRHHLASDILLNLFSYAKESGAEFISLEVRKSNIKAIGLYKKFGFEKQGVRKNYYSNPEEDGIIMTKFLK